MSAPAEQRDSVEDLLYGYIAAADDGDADRVSQVLAHARVDFAGQHAAGAAEVRAMFANTFRGGTRVRHLLSNVRIRIHQDGPRPTADFSATYIRWGARAVDGPLGLGEYTARLEQADDGWRITRFVIRRLWSRDPASAIPDQRPINAPPHHTGTSVTTRSDDNGSTP
ncbi:nuclear transport factor 2 family protein [Streptomyces adonidis]|uniref:nuclear transport factor 2 family protein n=1 Tax=Streptomyces adonidis TaxID=3231367 RepID=UPI0034DACE52